MSDQRERLAWADFRRAHKRIIQALDACYRTSSNSSLAKADGIEHALMELHDAFAHIHVASDDGDRCALCDLDLRNEIHVRA